MGKRGCLAAVYCRKICSSASHTDFSVSCFKLTYIYSCFSVLPVSLIPGSGSQTVCSWLESPPFLTPHLMSGSGSPAFNILLLLPPRLLFALSLNSVFVLSCHPRRQNQRPGGGQQVKTVISPQIWEEIHVRKGQNT